MNEITDLIRTLDLVRVSDNKYRAEGRGTAGGVVFGGQLMAQAISAAKHIDPGKVVKSVQTVFARGALSDQGVDIDIEVMSNGRSFSSGVVTFGQNGRICARSTVLMNTAEPDLIRHEEEMPYSDRPDNARVFGHGGQWWERRAVEGVDIDDPDSVGPASFLVWSRFPGAPDDLTVSQALLAYASDGFLIGTAMRPHKGFGTAMSHVSVSTSVLTHAITFHENFRASDWFLLYHVAPYAGRGRSYGRGDVFTEDGHLIASFSQDNMIRAFPKDRAPRPGGRSRY